MMQKGFWISLLVSLGFGLLWGILSYIRYHAWKGSLAILVLAVLMTFPLGLATTTASLFAYKRRCRKLEQLADRDEQGEA